ncbi:VWA domain-containing protein [Rhodococcus sp. NPDC056743]|uniref:VWA domain-containing protein n=1 Tax=Rhodococcus sp. NPDC056743 TaxID=3345934 RepID=UPI00366C8A77
MTNPDLTLIAVLLDRSGSMHSIKSDTEGGFNAFIAEQRTRAGAAVVTLAQFDTTYERVYTNIPVAEVPALDLRPRGGTALLDGIGRLTTEMGEELAALDESDRPGTVIVVVITDGEENQSQDWNLTSVKEVISRQESEYGWDYLFLGANIDAVSVGSRIGFSPDKSITYAASSTGVDAVFKATSDYASRKRSAPAFSPPVAGFSDADREATKK